MRGKINVHTAMLDAMWSRACVLYSYGAYLESKALDTYTEIHPSDKIYNIGRKSAENTSSDCPEPSTQGDVV